MIRIDVYRDYGFVLPLVSKLMGLRMDCRFLHSTGSALKAQ
jgi:hypothetical protein